MTAIEIGKMIDTPQAMMKFVGKRLAPARVLRTLTNIDSARDGYDRLKTILGDDPDGLKMLACMLSAATVTYAKYRALGISDRVFKDTLSCFTRFAEEHINSYGRYGFDRGWWTYRQLSLVLFKIGELEYEYRDDERTVHLHIPTGADISIIKCKNSLNEFTEFTAKYFPDKNYPIICESWLLSPALCELLPQNSKIIKFQSCFEITDRDKTGKEFLQWVYGRTDIDYIDLPEKTSLQRSMKAFLLNGGEVGSARGRLTDFI